MKSIMPFDREVCIECGARGTHTHHALYGRHRKNAEAYGLKVRLCWRCHQRLHDKDTALALKYQRMAQQCFEEKYGHDKFMEVFGKNYLGGDGNAEQDP